MNKLLKFLILILIITIPLVILTSCSNIEVETPKTVQEQLDLLLNNLQNSTQKINGSTHYNDTLFQNYSGNIDKNALKMTLKINDTDYYYSSKVLLKAVNNKYTVENPDTNLAQQKNLMPFSLLYFSYSEGNSDSIFMTDKTINISFINKGAKLSFDSDKSVTDGYLSIYFEQDKICNSVFTALEGNKKLTAFYEYEQVSNPITEAPVVHPTDTLSYAIYAISKFSKKYSEQTLHTKDNFNTEAKISAVILEKTKVKSVTSVDITDQNKNYTLTINYLAKEMIVGVGSAITTLSIAYNIDYEINYVRINTTDYVLK